MSLLDIYLENLRKRKLIAKYKNRIAYFRKYGLVIADGALFRMRGV